MKGGLIILAVCAVAAAMTVRDEQVSPTDPTSTSEAPSSTPTSKICAPETPCGWLVYNPISRIEEYTINNSYCICSSNLKCLVNEDDLVSHSYVMRCRLPSKDSEEEFDSS